MNGAIVPVLLEIVQKYAYTPSGNSGVLQNLPLYSSKSPSAV